MVHTEVILQGNRSKRLRRILDLHILLRLYRLVQAIAPATALHDTTRRLINDLDLAIHDDVIHILLEHGIRLQQLDHRMHTLALDGEILHHGILLLLLLKRRQILLLDLGNLAAHIRKHEEIRIARRPRQELEALIRQIDAMLLLIDDEIQRIRHHRHLLLIVLHVEVFGLLHDDLDTRLTEILDQRLVLRQTLVTTEQQLAIAFFASFNVWVTNWR